MAEGGRERERRKRPRQNHAAVQKMAERVIQGQASAERPEGRREKD